MTMSIGYAIIALLFGFYIFNYDSTVESFIYRVPYVYQSPYVYPTFYPTSVYGYPASMYAYQSRYAYPPYYYWKDIETFAILFIEV